MSISIDLKSNLNKVTANFFPGCEKAIVRAARSAMSKTLTSLRAESNRQVRTKMALKAGDLNKDWFKETKLLKGNSFKSLDKFIAVLHVRNKPISFIKLVRGSAKPYNQKGVRIKARKKLRIEIKKGKVVKYRDLFIARANGGVYHVFRRAPKGQRGVLHKQSAPSVHFLFEKAEFRRPIESTIGKRLQELFISQLDYELRKVPK